jgi:hypothetical protein
MPEIVVEMSRPPIPMSGDRLFDRVGDSAFNWYNQETADNLVAAQSWTRYDPLIAIPRLVEQFARLGLRLTFFVSIGKQSGPRIGIEKGPLTGLGAGLSR